MVVKARRWRDPDTGELHDLDKKGNVVQATAAPVVEPKLLDDPDTDDEEEKKQVVDLLPFVDEEMCEGTIRYCNMPGRMGLVQIAPKGRKHVDGYGYRVEEKITPWRLAEMADDMVEPRNAIMKSVPNDSDLAWLLGEDNRHPKHLTPKEQNEANFEVKKLCLQFLAGRRAGGIQMA